MASRRCRTNERQFECFYVELLSLTREAENGLGYYACKFAKHCYRHGDTLHLFMEWHSADTIAMRGRWTSFRPLKRYLKNSCGRILSLQAQPYTQERVEKRTALSYSSNGRLPFTIESTYFRGTSVDAPDPRRVSAVLL